MPIFNNALAGAAGSGGAAAGYEITRSLRFDSSSSSYLNRTPSSAGNRTKWTWSGWVKRSKLGVTNQSFFGSENGSNREAYLAFLSNDKLKFGDTGTGSSSYILELTTTQVFRDPSAWYHIVAVWDSGNATQADKARLYVNGVRVTSFSTNTNSISPNAASYINGANQHFIGRYVNYSNAATHNDGYLAEVHFLDGLTPGTNTDDSSGSVTGTPNAEYLTDFGEFDATTGVWNPIEYSGTYGTNGFYLDFSDNSSNAALGTDSSGNSNTWTVNNISATALTDYLGTGTYTASEWDSVNTVDRIFDGNDGTFAFRPNGAGSGTSTFTFGVTVTVTSSLQIRGWKGDSGERIFANGVDISSHFNTQSGGGLSTQDVTSTVGSTPFTLTSVGSENQNNRAGALAKIIVDGVTLINGLPGDMDSLLDTPTNYDAASGNNGGNYATFNPLSIKANQGTMENGNLRISATNNYYIEGRSTIAASSFDNYSELTISSVSSNPSMGFAVGDKDTWIISGQGSYLVYRESGTIIRYPGNTTVATVASYTQGDVLGMAVDNTNVKFYKNGSLQGTYAHQLTGEYFVTAMTINGNVSGEYTTLDVNFGQRPFAYTPPTGYKSLCTQNLANPTIADGSDYFDIVTYGGNSSTQVINTSFGADLIWTKATNDTYRNVLIDTIRGGSAVIHSDRELAENTTTVVVSNFGNTSYTLGGTSNATNQTNKNYVAWYWDAGTTTDTNNTAGSITPTGVRANASAGFSIVSYTGNGAASATIGHGLNAAPEMIMVKNRDVADDGSVYHVGTDATNPQNYFLKLFAASPNGAAGRSDVGAMWNDTAPTSSVFSVGTEDNVNASTENYIAYCFAPVKGYSAFGSYTGNGSNDGPFVFTGMRPKFVLLKASSDTSNWYIYDTERDTYNIAGAILYPDTSTSEGVFGMIDVLSNGFKLRTSTFGNYSGTTFIYAAFAEHPFKTARAR